jgi:hypothetical protein
MSTVVYEKKSSNDICQICSTFNFPLEINDQDIPEVDFQTRCHLAYFSIKKKREGWLRASGSRYAKTIGMRQNVGREKQKSVSGFFTKITNVQVMNFIPVKVSTLYSWT